MSQDAATLTAVSVDQSEGDFSYPEDYEYNAGVGINDKVLDYIGDAKDEDDWIRDFRKRALKVFNDKPMPTHWASKDLENIHFDEIRYYLSGARPRSGVGTTCRRK